MFVCCCYFDVCCCVLMSMCVVVVLMLYDVDATVDVACVGIDVDVCCCYAVLLYGLGLIPFRDDVGVMLMLDGYG